MDIRVPRLSGSCKLPVRVAPIKVESSKSGDFDPTGGTHD
jgi:hypothetical protein